MIILRNICQCVVFQILYICLKKDNCQYKNLYISNSYIFNSLRYFIAKMLPVLHVILMGTMPMNSITL